MSNRLPIFVVLFLLLGALSAQESSDSRRITSDPARGFLILLSQAQSGDREAQYRVAQLYAFPEGTSVAKNEEASREWMLKSAEQGFAPAELGLGLLYLYKTGNRGEAEIWLRRAAEQGYDEAQFCLGAAYKDGRFGTRDYREAFQWLRSASEQGNAAAQGYLGEMYEDGEFVSQSYALAAKWYRKAAEHSPDMGGEGHGRNQLGMLYEDGLGVPKNLVLAYMWFSLTQFPENLKEVECDMTRAQIAQARKMALDWIKAHPEEHDTIAQRDWR